MKNRSDQSERGSVAGGSLLFVRYVFLLAFFLCFPRSSDADSFATTLEKTVGKQVAWALINNSGLDNDPLLVNWVRRVGGEVAAASPRRDVRCSFSILATDVANAYAAPGGYIFVTRGLLDSIESDDELAGVLAHETGHVAKKHAVQQITENLAFIGILQTLHSHKYEKTRTAASVYNVFRGLERSRSMEAQADELGLEFSTNGGYDPNGLADFLGGLGYKYGWLEQYFATHPSPDKRLKKARENPYIVTPDTAKIAAGLERRGMPALARVAQRGRNTLPLRPLPPLDLNRVPAYVREERGEVVKAAEDSRKALNGPYKVQRAASIFQQVLFFNNRLSDPRWIYLAARAYAVQTDVEDITARTSRVINTSLPVYDALAGDAERGVGTSLTVNSSLGRGEVIRALQTVKGAPKCLSNASQAVAAVLADLNNRFYNPKGNAAWLRYGSLEALLQYAESEIGRADKMSGEAWRTLSVARVRRYQNRLDNLIPETNGEGRTLWYELASQRFGATFPQTGATGAVSVQVALAIETGKVPAELETGRGATPWADWIVKSGGAPENIATALRLLTLDWEREMAARENERR